MDMKHIKVIDTKPARDTHQYKNLKQKLVKQLRMLPEDGLWKTETYRSLHCTFMICKFLMVLTV